MVACGLSPVLAGKLLQGPPSPRIFNGSPLPSGSSLPLWFPQGS